MKRLLLVGGGHAQLAVLQRLARARPADVEVLLVTPSSRLLYSGMVPGVVAGHYRDDEAAIDLAPWLKRAGVTMLATTVVALDASAREATLADGRRLAWDLLSLDTGGVIDADAIPGAAEHALPVRPLETFVDRWEALVAHGPRRGIAVIGGGAAGVELSLASAHRLAGRVPVHWVGGADGLSHYPAAVRRHAARALARLGVEWLAARCTHIEADAVELADGTRRPVDAAILATGSTAPRWLRGSGLALDAQGFVATGPTLASVSHPAVFAAGDVASRTDAPHPRSGVYAVRAGPVLASNLIAAADGSAMRAWQPQRVSLNLISLGARRAIAQRGRWCAAGRWAWWWKDRIDRAFVARFR